MGRDLDDTATMRKVVSGDEQAFACFVRRWQGPVQGYIRRFLGCTIDEAADLAQEAFIRVWTARQRWRPESRVSTWLFTIVSNLCRNRRRDSSRRPHLVLLDPSDPGELDHPTTDDDDPHHRAVEDQLATSLLTAIAELPEQQRSALLLRQVEGLSYKEIANILGTSDSAVDALLSRARRNLAKKIHP